MQRRYKVKGIETTLEVNFDEDILNEVIEEDDRLPCLINAITGCVQKHQLTMEDVDICVAAAKRVFYTDACIRKG